MVRGFWSGRFVSDGHCIVLCWLAWHGAALSPSEPGNLVLGLQKLVSITAPARVNFISHCGMASTA